GAGIPVTIFYASISDGTNCIGGIPIGTFFTDVNGQVELLGWAGGYCAQAELGTNASATGTVDPLDPTDDIDITIVAPAATSVLDVSTGVYSEGDIGMSGVIINVYPDDQCGQAVLYS